MALAAPFLEFAPEPKLELTASHTYEAAGAFTVQVKVIDILGNDTTRTLKVEVK